MLGPDFAVWALDDDLGRLGVPCEVAGDLDRCALGCGHGDRDLAAGGFDLPVGTLGTDEKLFPTRHDEKGLSAHLGALWKEVYHLTMIVNLIDCGS